MVAKSLDDEVESLELTDDEFDDLNTAEGEVEAVSYSGTDFDAEGLVRRLNRGDIVVPTFGHGDPTLEVAGFQRGFVWRRPQMDRFIESLLLGYPIPGIMLVQQADRRYLVLDGQQRLRTLSAFYGGVHQGKEFELQNVALPFRGLTYKSLNSEQRRQLDNTFIQATIVKTDGSRESLDAVYQVFERLNSGGTQLTPHEIRIALYPGELVDLLSELNALQPWRDIYGAKSPRLRDQELVLRIVALYVNQEKYTRPLKKFLNDFVGDHRNLEGLNVPEIRRLFAKTSELLLDASGRGSIRYQSTQVNTALTEALFVGLMRKLKKKPDFSVVKVRSALRRLTANKELPGVISGGTATEEYLRTRLALATAEFNKG
ncbi:DUF262 domain-containing protein [Dactylosporangium sp. NPDC049742]|uniref:DUF262 domain-containing protein n=1 Tax=Dactylosporangium sp. NPDC049742 TaxID=3154737 RepID=UPI003430E64F